MGRPGEREKRREEEEEGEGKGGRTVREMRRRGVRQGLGWAGKRGEGGYTITQSRRAQKI